MSGTSSSDEAVAVGSDFLGLGSPSRRDGDSDDDEEDGHNRGHSWTWMPQAKDSVGKGATGTNSGRKGPEIDGGRSAGDSGGRSGGGGGGGSSSRSVRTLTVGKGGSERVKNRRVVHGSSGNAKRASSKRHSSSSGASARDGRGSIQCPIHQLAIAPITRGNSSGNDDTDRDHRYHNTHGGGRSRGITVRSGGASGWTVTNKPRRSLSKPITISRSVREKSRTPVTSSERDAYSSSVTAAIAEADKFLNQGVGNKASGGAGTYVGTGARRPDTTTATTNRRRELRASLPPNPAVPTTLPRGALDGMKAPAGAWQQHSGSVNPTGYSSASTTTVGMSQSSSFSDVLLNDEHLRSRIASSAANAE